MLRVRGEARPRKVCALRLKPDSVKGFGFCVLASVAGLVVPGFLGWGFRFRFGGVSEGDLRLIQMWLFHLAPGCAQRQKRTKINAGV